MDLAGRIHRRLHREARPARTVASHADRIPPVAYGQQCGQADSRRAFRHRPRPGASGQGAGRRCRFPVVLQDPAAAPDRRRRPERDDRASPVESGKEPRCQRSQRHRRAAPRQSGQPYPRELRKDARRRASFPSKTGRRRGSVRTARRHGVGKSRGALPPWREPGLRPAGRRPVRRRDEQGGARRRFRRAPRRNRVPRTPHLPRASLPRIVVRRRTGRRYPDDHPARDPAPRRHTLAHGKHLGLDGNSKGGL